MQLLELVTNKWKLWSHFACPSVCAKWEGWHVVVPCEKGAMWWCHVRRVACGGTMWAGCHVVVPCEKGAACYSKAAVSVRAHDTFTHSVLRFDACLLPEIFNVLPSVSLHSCVACLGDSLCRPAWSRGKGYCFGVYISIWEGGMFSRGAGRLLFMRMCVIIPFLGRLLYVVCAAFCVPYISLY